MPLQPNEKGQRRGGRQKGTPNKKTVAVKEALSMAFQGVGGVPGLTRWAEGNRTEFYKLWAKMLPQDLKVSGSLTLEQLVMASMKPEAE